MAGYFFYQVAGVYRKTWDRSLRKMIVSLLGCFGIKIRTRKSKQSKTELL